MAEKDCLNNENELNSSIIGSNEVQSQLNIDNLSSELGENSDISSILAIDDINSEMNPDLSTDSNLSENNQVESELDIPVSIQGEIPEIPTKLSEFENDVGFITLEDIPEYPEKLSELVNDGDGSSPFATEAFVLQNAGSGGGGGPTVPVVDNLTSLSTTSALSANQGRVLNEKITEVEGNIPTNISELNNDAGFVSKTVSDLENYTTTDKMNEALNNKADRTEIPDISGKVDKSELTDYVSKEELQKENFLKEIPSEYVTEEELSSAISNKADKSDIPDISGKADKSEIPDISGLATKTEVQSKSEEILKSANDYTDTKVAELIDSAPETLDTFKEIADAFAEDQEVLDTLNSAIGLKADKSEIPDISGKADKSELSNYVTNTTLEGKGYLTSIPTEYVTESELTAKDYATNTTVNGKLGKTENAVSATKATQDGDGNEISSTYVKTSKIVNTTNKTFGNATGWSSAGYGTNIPSLNTIAYWDGRYAEDMTRGNLAYCNKGAFGDMATKNSANYTLKTDNIISAYGTCSTAAGTAAKVVTIADTNWTLKVGTVIGVKFTNSNTASNVTLNVDSTGAKSIYYNNAKYTGNSQTICGYANRLVYYMYDGTYWVWFSTGVELNDNNVPSAISWTTSGTQAKTATCHNYALLAKSYTQVIMANANTYNGAITLNINGKGAKPIYINGVASSSSNKTLPAGSYLTYYDGTAYHFRTDGSIAINNLATPNLTDTIAHTQTGNAVVIESYLSGDKQTWYRKWSDGWKECGGISPIYNVNTDNRIELPIEFSNTNYNVELGNIWVESGGHNVAWDSGSINDRTNQSFVLCNLRNSGKVTKTRCSYRCSGY